MTVTITIPAQFLIPLVDILDLQRRLDQTVCGFDPVAVALRSDLLARLLEVG